MRRSILLLLLLTATLALPRAARADPATRWGAFVEDDVGVLVMSGGLGLFGGATRGPWRLGLGFYRFDSPFRALSGAPEGFELKVDAMVSLDVSWHFLSQGIEGPYLRAAAQFKEQRVENLQNGARRGLESVLAGPELGWTIRVHRGLYVAPRAGALLYLEPPQGRRGHPVDVGGRPYDNDRHKAVDLFATLGLGYTF